MKFSSIFLLLLIHLFFMQSCKTDPGIKPMNENTGNDSNYTPTNLEAQNQLIQGVWTYRQRQYIYQISSNGFSSDSLVSYENQLSPSACIVEFTNLQVFPNDDYKKVNGSLTCAPSPFPNYYWKIVTPNQLLYNGSILIIETLTTDSLVLYTLDSGLKVKYIYNKTGMQPGLSPTEMLISRNWNLVETIYVNFAGWSTSQYNCSGSFSNQWDNSNLGWKINGFIIDTTVAPFVGNGYWEVVEGRINISGSHYKIDTLSSNKLVITKYPPSGGSQNIMRYRFE